MLACGIDVSKGRHEVVLKSKERKLQAFSLKNDREGFMKFLEKVPKDAIVGMEATNQYHKTLEWFLKNNGYPVYVFNPRKTHNFGAVNHFRMSTDKMDAEKLADFILMGFHETQKQRKDKYPVIKQYCRLRMKLLKDKVKYQSRILNRLSVVFPEFESLFAVNFGVTYTEILEKYTQPERFAELSVGVLGKELASFSMGILKEERAEKIINAAKGSVEIRENIDGYTEEIKTCIKYVKELDTDIERITKKIRSLMDDIPQNLTKIRGIDMPLAASIISEIGDISQFSGRKALFNFTGMTPTVKQSGKFTGQSRMSKNGSKHLRTAIWLAAICCINHNKVFRDYFMKKTLVDKKRKIVAVGAVARKLSYHVYASLKNGDGFDPEREIKSLALSG